MSDPFVALALAAVLVVVFLAVIFAARQPSDRTGLSGGDGKLQSIEKRLGAVEETVGKTQHDLRNVKMVVQNLPSKDASHRLELELNTLGGKVSKVEAEVTSTMRAVDRIEEILLKGLKP